MARMITVVHPRMAWIYCGIGEFMPGACNTLR